MVNRGSKIYTKPDPGMLLTACNQVIRWEALTNWYVGLVSWSR